MADRATTPRKLRQSAYIPEDNPKYHGYMDNPDDYYALADAVAQASMVLPPGASSLVRGAIDASRLAGANATKLAVSEMANRRLLAPPRRNAMYPEEMLPPNVIQAGSAEGAPRLAYTRPETQYRQAVDIPAQGRPQTNYERPVWDETFVPLGQARTRNEVVTEPSAASRLASESPQADRALAVSQQRARENEARFVADSEARATGEGMRERVTDADRAVAQARRDAAEREFRAMEEARATGEGMRTRPGRDFDLVGTPYDPMGRSLERMYAGTDAAAMNAPRNSAQMGTNLPALVDRHFGAPAAMQRSFARANPQSANPMSLPVATGTVVAGAMTRPGQGTLPNSAGMDRAEDEGFYRSVGAAQFPSSSGIDRNEDENFYRSVGAARLPSSTGIDQTDYPMRSPAVSAAKRAIPMPPTRPSDLPREEPGILSRIFSGKDYQSNNREVVKDGTVNWGNSDNSADFFRADKARMEMEGKAGGGSVGGKPDKDAALHKALEIIHHMIRSH